MAGVTVRGGKGLLGHRSRADFPGSQRCTKPFDWTRFAAHLKILTANGNGGPNGPPNRKE